MPAEEAAPTCAARPLNPGCEEAPLGFGVFRWEEQRRNLFFRRILLSDDHVDERDEHRGDWYRQEYVDTSEQESDRRHGDEHHERREPDRMAEHPWDDDVVLEQAHAEHGEAGAKRNLPGDGESDSDRHGAGRQRADDGDDLD